MIKALSDSPEILSLQSGSLKYDFGLNFDPTQEIIYAVANSTYVYFKNFRFNKNSVTNVLSVYIQPEDFRNLLNSGSAQVITSDGVVIPWLYWLLTAGDAVVVTQYHVDYGSYNASRSGGAIMKPGGVFKVDSEFSGTVDDNFITRAIKGYESQITDIIRTSL
jgi:predicted ribosome-associated RNA-binding protein Tma20